MTTAIALETSKGDLGFAPALGIILITLSMMVSGTSLFIGLPHDPNAAMVFARLRHAEFPRQFLGRGMH
jgi:hypothetical protein